MHTLTYRVRIQDPDTHRYHVTLTVPRPDPAGQVFALPRWIPGSYLIREFARHWLTLEAHSQGRTVTVEKLDTHRWRAAPCPGPLTLTAQIHAHDRSVREAYLDRRLGFFNGTSLFLRPQGWESSPCEVEILPPTALPWRLATSLRPLAVDAAGFGRYQADDYDELIDHPVLMGPLRSLSFTAGNLPHHFHLAGLPADLPLGQERLAADLTRICTTQQRLFGGPPPIPAYHFLAWATEKDYGGLEHRAVSALMFPRGDLPDPHPTPPDKGYRRLLSLCAHEYLHTWLVKGIRPARLAAADLTGEVHTRDLWIFEGITSYYDDLALLRSGLVDLSTYLADLGELLTRVLRTPGRHHHSIAQSSHDAWIKLYRADAHAPNLMSSYYSKGALTALALDLHLRRQSDDAASLDTVMAELWRRHGPHGTPLPEGAFPALVHEVTGIDIGEFVRRYVEGPEDPPLSELLSWLGLRLLLRRAEGPDDAGGRPPRRDPEHLARQGWLGCTLHPGEDRIATVRAGSPAEAAGLAPGDRLLAIGEEALDPARWWEQIARHRPGDSVTLHYRHDGLRQSARTILAQPPRDTACIQPEADPDPATLARREAWMQGP